MKTRTVNNAAEVFTQLSDLKDRFKTGLCSGYEAKKRAEQLLEGVNSLMQGEDNNTVFALLLDAEKQLNTFIIKGY